MDYSLAKELKDAGFPQIGKSCDTHSDINDSTLVERVAHPGLSELIEACPKQMGTATFVLGSANQGQAWVACYFDFRANRGAELNETGETPDETPMRCPLMSVRSMSRRSSPSLAGRAGQVMPPHAGRMEDNNNSAKHANALSAHERSVDVAAILPVARGTCAAVSTFNGSSARLRQAANWISAQYYDRFGCLPVLGRRSDADRRSTPDRRSPMRLFSSPLRVSTPLRRSFPERRSDPLRLSSTLMGLLLSDLLRQQNRE